MRIVVDNREQCPWDFHGPAYEGTIAVRGTLDVGDYSIHGLESRIAVERKGFPDLVQCLGNQRKRFWAELQKAKSMDSFAVIIEGTWRDLAQGNYRSQLNPKSAVASVMAASSRLGIPFLFCETRAGAEYACYEFLRMYAKGLSQWAKGVLEAAG